MNTFIPINKEYPVQIPFRNMHLRNNTSQVLKTLRKNDNILWRPLIGGFAVEMPQNGIGSGKATKNSTGNDV